MDASDLTALLRRHAGLIHKVAYAYCRDATDREDVIQEIVVRTWRSLDRYDPRCKETTWLYRIAVNTAISFHRRERRHRDRREPFDLRAFSIAAPTAAEPDDDVRILLDCIQDLAPLDRALVLMSLDGVDHAAIADVLGISASNVGTKLLRIRKRLRAAVVQRRATDSEGPHAAR